MSYIGSIPALQMTEVGTGAVETQDIQDGAVTAAKLAPGAAVPSQTGNSAKYLTTDGTTSSWGPAVASFNTRTGAVTLSSGDVTGALGFTPYNSTNPNGYISSITGSNVTTALGFTPYNATNPNGYISSITSGNVTTALGFTPYNATNPSGYTTNTGTVTSVGGTGTVSGLTLTGSVSTTGNLTLGGTLSLTSGNVTTALGFTPENSANRGVANGYASLDGSGLVPSTQLPSYVDDVLEYANLAGFPATGTTGKIYVAIDTNKTYRWSGSAYVYITSGAVDSVAGKTGVVSLVSSDVGLGNVENKSSATIRGEISSANVTTALGFTPYNSSNPSGYITGITSANVTTALGFTPYNATNPNGYITTSALSGYLTSATAASTYQPIGSYLTGITSSQVTTALGFTPYNSSNPSGYITGITSANVTSALGYTPYNSTNPSGYITSSGSISGSAGSLSSNSSYIVSRTGIADSNYNTTTTSGYYTVSYTGASSSMLVWNAGGSTGPVQMEFFYPGTARYRNQTDSASWNAWKTLITDANYNSYTPTLTGTGASGTWSINISGNAATASSSPLLSALGYYVWTASTAPSAYNLGIQTSFVNDGLGYQSYGSVINVKSYAGGGGSLQMFVPYSPSYGGNSLAVRFGNYDAGDAWTSWKTLLASDNYTGYAMPVGSSATNSVDVRAPIFYDSNNTAYYGDFAGNSNLNTVNANRFSAAANTLITIGDDSATYTINDSAGRSRFYVTSNYPSITLNGQISGSNAQHGPTLQFTHNGYDSNRQWVIGTGGTGQFMDFGTAQPANKNPHEGISGYQGPTIMRMTVAGNVGIGGSWGYYGNITNPSYPLHVQGTGYASSDLRAPLFYDSDNTGYYFNPNGVSNLNTTVTGNNAMYFRANRNTSSDSPPLQAYSDNGSGAIMSFHRGGYYAVNFGLDSDNVMRIGGWSAASSRWQLDMDGNEYLAGSSRAPIFYDYDNTSYYVNPNSSSYLHSLSLSGAAYFYPNNWIGLGGDYGIYNYSAGGNGAHFLANQLSSYGSWRIIGYRSSYGGIYDTHSGVNIGMFDSAGNGGFYREANGRWYQYYNVANDCTGFGTSSTASAYNIWCGKGIYSDGRIDGTIFYDSNNTGYYVDPASTTNLNAVNVVSLNIGGVAVTAGGGSTGSINSGLGFNLL